MMTIIPFQKTWPKLNLFADVVVEFINAEQEQCLLNRRKLDFGLIKWYFQELFWYFAIQKEINNAQNWATICGISGCHIYSQIQ